MDPGLAETEVRGVEDTLPSVEAGADEDIGRWSPREELDDTADLGLSRCALARRLACRMI